MVRFLSGCQAVMTTALCLAFPLSSARAEDPEFAPEPEFAAAVGRHEVGPCSAVAVNRRGEIVLAHRGKRPVMCLDARGALLLSWGDGVVKTAHGVRVDGNDDVWVTDIGNHRVYQFSRAGKLLLALGTGQPGAGEDEFDRPTDVAFGSGGDFYVSDGYGNSRVLKFNKDGKRIGSWGVRGKGEGEFHLPHALLVDRAGNVLVGDRENNRVQVFNAEAKFQKVWNGFAPYGLAFDSAGHVWVADARAHQVLELDADGKVIRRMGKKGSEPGQFMTPHMLEFDAAGNLFVAEVDGRRLQKFVRKAN
ncbi:MAG: hypothetical protein IT428_15405 [Planctomycetaceae bacterium]|nr:hypothetical protein [Planctomycetaceae bacterium]